MSLILRREENETWREAAIRQAKEFGLEQEVTADYDRYRLSGDPEAQSALKACSEWDVLTYEKDEKKE